MHIEEEHNEYYKSFLRQHNSLLDADGVLTISSYDLFICMEGIECAMYPHLYPTARFTDSGIRSHVRAEIEDGPARVVSIARSWTRKALSAVRVYAEHRDLAFFMYEKWMAMKFFHAQVRVYLISLQERHRQCFACAQYLHRTSSATCSNKDRVKGLLQ